MKRGIARAGIFIIPLALVWGAISHGATLTGGEPIKMRAGVRIEAASAIFDLLTDLGLLPRMLTVGEARAGLTLSATGELKHPSADGQLVLQLLQPETLGFRAGIGHATASFLALVSPGQTLVEVPTLVASLGPIRGKPFGFDVTIDHLSLDGSGTYRSVPEKRGIAFRDMHERAGSLVVEASPARLELTDVELLVSHLESDLGSASPISIASGTATLAVSTWTFFHPAIGNLEGTVQADLIINQGVLHARNIDIGVHDPLPFSVKADTDFDLSDSTGTLRAELSLFDALAGTFTGNVRLGQEIQGSFDGTLEIEDIEALWPALGPHLGEDIAQWLVGGSAAGNFSGTLIHSPDGPQIEATVELKGRRLQGLSPDVTIGWSGSEFVLSSTHELRGQRFDSALSLAVVPGEVLFGGVYLKPKEQAINVRLIAGGDLREQRVHLRQGEIETAHGAARLQFDGEAQRDGGGTRGWLHADTGNIDLAQLYRELASAVLHEGTEGYSLAGEARVETALHADSGLVFEGTATVVSAAVVSAKPPVAINEFDLSLPYRLMIASQPQDPSRLGVLARESPSDPSRLGVLARDQHHIGTAEIGWATVAGVPVAGLRFHPRLWNNRFELVDGLDFDLIGGKVTLSRLEIGDVLAPLSHVLLSGAVEKINLTTLCRALDLPPLQGTATLRVPEAAVDGKDLVLPGETRIEVFGGTIRIQDLRIEDCFGLSPILAFSADFEGLNLGEMTSVIPLGRMDGAIKGSARDFRISLDPLEPYSFDVVLETDDAVDLPRTISIEAIRTVVSVGETGGFQLPWAFRFFDHYTYSRLGLHLRLRNDVIHMEGLIRKGNQSYFLLGSGMARVNILAPPTEQGYPYRKLVSTLKSRIRQIQEKGFSGVGIE